jgi:hypothetical protein
MTTNNPLKCSVCEAQQRKGSVTWQVSPSPKRVGWQIVFVGPPAYACNYGHHLLCKPEGSGRWREGGVE